MSPVLPLWSQKMNEEPKGEPRVSESFCRNTLFFLSATVASMSPRQSDRAWSTRALYTPWRAVPLANGGGGGGGSGNPPSRRAHAAASPPSHAARWTASLRLPDLTLRYRRLVLLRLSYISSDALHVHAVSLTRIGLNYAITVLRIAVLHSSSPVSRTARIDDIYPIKERYYESDNFYFGYFFSKYDVY